MSEAPVQFTPPPDHGTLDAYYIADVLAALYRSGRTGALRVERGVFLKTLYVQDGQVAYASSNAQSDRLGEVLIRHGLLTPEQLDDAMKRLQPDVSLGKILVQLGYLSPKELVQGAHLQVTAVVDSLFQWTEGTYHFMEGPLPKQVVNLHIPLPALVLEHTARHAPVAWVRRYLPEDQEARASLLEAFYRVQPEMNLPSNFEEVFTWLDGRSTVEEIAAQTGLEAFFVAKVIVGLGILGLAEVTLTPRPAPTLETAPAGPEALPVSPTTEAVPEPTETLSVEAPEPEPTTPSGEAPVPSPTRPFAGVVTVPQRRYRQRMAAAARLRRLAIAVFLTVLAVGLSGLALWLWLQGRSPQPTPLEVPVTRPLPSSPPAPTPPAPSPEKPPMPSSAPSPPSPPVESPPPTPSPPVTVETRMPAGPGPEVTRLIEQKDLPAAARRSSEWLRRQDPQAWTVQVELACRSETVLQALRQVRNPEQMYILPKSFRGQSCYVVGYGLFQDPSAAEEVRQTHLSEELLRQPSPPRVVSVRQLLRIAGE
jgi:outer membrane biosynthesis protein TonB